LDQLVVTQLEVCVHVVLRFDLNAQVEVIESLALDVGHDRFVLCVQALNFARYVLYLVELPDRLSAYHDDHGGRLWLEPSLA
jgi:hypothetical protein